MKKSTKLASLVLAAVVALNGLALPTFAAVPFLETQTGIISKQVNYTPGVTVTKPTAEDLEGEYGESDICIGVPVILGRNGWEKVVDFKLNAEEKAAFEKSAAAVHKTNSVLKEINAL